MNKRTIIITIVIIFFDQLSKMIIESFLTINQSITVIPNFFSLHYIMNYGTAWNLFQNKIWFILTMNIIGIIVLIRFFYTFKNNKRNNIAFGFLFGGVFGNLIDRGLFGYVRDFLDFNIFGYDYPVFNIADASIVIGIVLLIYAIIKGEDRKELKDNEKDNSKRRKTGEN